MMDDEQLNDLVKDMPEDEAEEVKVIHETAKAVHVAMDLGLLQFTTRYGHTYTRIEGPGSTVMYGCEGSATLKIFREAMLNDD